MYRKCFALFLIGLFFFFSFNAYACLVPIYGGIEVAQGSDCTSPGEEPATQFCDGFKSLAIQSNTDLPGGGTSYLILTGNGTPLSPTFVTTNYVFPMPSREHVVPPRDILVLISVFRN